MARPQFTNRRTVLKTIGGGMAGVTALAGTAAAGDHTFSQQLNTVRATTRKYRDLEIATGEGGYEFFEVVDFVGVIYSNFDNLDNTDPGTDPTLLFYAPTRNAEIEGEDDVENTNTILAGIEYHVSGDHGEDQDMFADEEASREFKVTEAEGWHANPAGEPITGLHVWAHLPNPDGLFATEHPTIRDRLTG